LSSKRLYVGGMEFGIADDQVETVVARVTEALRNGSFQTVEVLDDGDRRVTLYLNGRTVGAVVLDLDAGPKPHEIS